MNSDNTNALQVVFKKKIDGTMYVVEAVPDSQRNALAVVSAYIQKNGGSKGQVLNIPQSEPQLTPETPVSSNAPATDTVTQEAPVVNTRDRAGATFTSLLVFAVDFTRSIVYYETATVLGWRSYLLILIVTVNPKICSVIITGICSPPFGWCS